MASATWEGLVRIRTLTKLSFSIVIVSIVIVSIAFSSNFFIPVYAVEQYIHGIGYGNGGLRFSSVVSCADEMHFFQESKLEFDGTASTPKGNSLASGTWQMSFLKSDESQQLLKKGYITKIIIDNKKYTIVGNEVRDDVCKDVGSSVILSGKCTNNDPIQFLTSNGEKIGSTTPPVGDKVYHVFGSEVNCY
jgi:hypothetical protein